MNAIDLRARRSFVALWAAVLLVTGCAAKEETPPVRIVALDRAFEAPQGIAAGLRHIIFENRGSEIHEAMFVKLPPGMTTESYLAALKSGVSFPKGAVDYSGPGLTSPGESVELWLKLDPGEYTLICYNHGHASTTRVHSSASRASGRSRIGRRRKTWC